MNASGFLEWLRESLDAAQADACRSILRFASPGDYRQFLDAFRTTRRRGRGLPNVRQIGIIRAVSCSLPRVEIPSAWRERIIYEEDGLVRIQSYSRTTSSIAEPGIPWGVRHIEAPQAWNRTTGHNVRVGIIDTGVDFQHPDLQHSLDRGINLVYRTLPPQDDNGHGTHIAGTIAAANRLRGMIGVAPRASIHPVKAFDYNGTAYVSDIIMGIDWCVRNRMNIVNMSFGMKTRSKSLLQAVEGAHNAGVLVVASSGNDGRSGDIDYPARYGQTLSVGATNREGRVASFTNRSGMIDVYAPGDKIVSSWLRGKYREMDGTSMATSHVSGAAALLIAHKPGLTPDQIKEIIKRSAKPLKGSKAPRTAGELNVVRMLKEADKRIPQT